MNWAFTIAALVIGIILGYVIRSMFSRNAENRSSNKELEVTKLEMSQHKQEVADHLDEHYELLSQLTAQLNTINQHWNDSATGLGLGPNKQALRLLATQQDEIVEEAQAEIEVVETATIEAPEASSVALESSETEEDNATTDETVEVEEKATNEGEKTS